MIPVNLVKIDGYNGFLGTFDNENWWKTKPLPGEIDLVTDAIWVYGQYHLCSANMSDGTFSIYQSIDNGYTWSQVLNTAERINGIFKPDYGIALAATSGGWWRSTNSGKTWTKVTTSAPNCFCCKPLTREVLLALSQNNIWQSLDGGLSWTSTKTSSENIIYPAVGGTYYDCLVGIGKRLFYSDDGGSTWTDITEDPGMYTWPDISEYVAITDIELTSVSGSFSDNLGTYVNVLPTWVIQIELTSGYLKHYYSIRTPGWGIIKHEAKFLAKKSINNSLISMETLRTGTSEIDKVVIFVGTSKYNLPMIKISEDAGETWSEIDTSGAVIYTGPDMSQISSSDMFTSDMYFSARWTHAGLCHNSYTTYNTFYERNQSFDIDFITKLSEPYDKTYQSDVCNKIILNTSYTMDILSQSKNNITYSGDILSQGTALRQYIISSSFQGTHPIYHELDIALAIRTINEHVLDIIMQKDVSLEYFPRCYVTDSEPKTYGMVLKIIGNHTEEVMNLVERYTPQAPDIRYPNIPYNVCDFRKEGVTL